MEYFEDVLNNRELAAVAWLLLILLLTLLSKTIRKSIKAVVQAFFSWKIQLLLGMALIYTLGCIWILYYLTFWDVSLIKDSVLWFVVVGVLMLFGLKTYEDQSGYFRNVITSNIRLMVVVEFIINLEAFSLAAELILLPVFTVFVLLQTYSEYNDEYKTVNKLMDSILAVSGLILMILTIYNMSGHYRDFLVIATLKSFTFPIIMTLLYLPFVFFAALYMVYESLFSALGIYINNWKDLVYAKVLLIWRCNIQLKKLKKMRPKINQLYNGCSRDEIRDSLK